MKLSWKTNLLLAVIFMLLMAAILCLRTTASAATEPPNVTEPPNATEPLSVNEVWLTGDTLHISVADKPAGTSQTLEMNLSDYALTGDEFVSVQAVDSGGNKSNVIQFKNPYYNPGQPGNATVGEANDDEPTISSVPDNLKPFTPDGTGEVVDNATDGDGKEFFTITTEGGNDFYLIIDRQRTADNVYLLNTVTENDLASLAKPGDGKPESATPTISPLPATPSPEPSPEPTTPPTTEKGRSSMGTIALVAVVVVAVGGAGYYIKIARPKRNAPDADDYEDEPDGGDGEFYFDESEKEDSQ
jgi:hypothetical protein